MDFTNFTIIFLYHNILQTMIHKIELESCNLEYVAVKNDLDSTH